MPPAIAIEKIRTIRSLSRIAVTVVVRFCSWFALAASADAASASCAGGGLSLALGARLGRGCLGAAGAGFAAVFTPAGFVAVAAAAILTPALL
jgi:hypothetical protein